MKKTAVLASIFITLIFMGTTIGAEETEEAIDKIRVGVLLPLTGKLSTFGEIERKAFVMAVDEINEAGGINGKQIDLIVEDTEGIPETGKAAIKKLIEQDEVSVVSGGISSSVTWAAVKSAQKNKVPFLVSTASADKITEKGGDYIFRLNAPVSEYHIPVFSFLTDVAQVKTVGILYENTLFGQSRLKEFLEKCNGFRPKGVAKEVYEVGKSKIDQLISINSRRPDLFYIISSSTGTDASLIVKQAKDLNLDVKLYVGGGAGFTLRKFQENAGDASEYVFVATPWTPSVQYPGASDFYKKFIAKYSEPTEYHGAQAYAAMSVIADALKRAQSHTPQDVRDALAETDIMTVFGTVKFISYGKKKFQNKIQTFLGQWLNGRLEAVWPKNLSTVKYVYPVPVRDELIEIF